MNARRTAVVTGASGFIGTHLTSYLGSLGWHVIGVGRGCSADRINVESLRAIGADADLVVHCAGGASVAQSVADPIHDFHETVPPVAEVLEFIRQIRPAARLVLLSSGAVYGDAVTLPISETDQTIAVSPYGTHKLLTEELCRFHARYFGTRVSIVRLFSVYGEGLCKQLLWDASHKARNSDFSFAGSGREVRDWLHVSDAVSLIAACADAASAAAPVFNGGSGSGTTVSHVVATLFSALSVDATARFTGAARTGDPTSFVADISRARSLGWSPQTALVDGIAAYARWFLENT